MAFLPGEVHALLAALTWAVALVLFKYSGERVAPLSLNLFKGAISTAMLLITIAIAACLLPNLDDASWRQLTAQPARNIWLMILSGVIGIALADTLFFYSLNIVGVGVISIIDCLYTPFVFLFAMLLLQENVTVVHWVGAALILTGVLIASRHKPPANLSRWRLVGGMATGAAAMCAMAFGIVIIKPALAGFPLLWAAAIRLAAAVLVMCAIAPFLSRNGGVSPWNVFRPSRVWRTAVPGAVMGTYLAYLFWISGFKYADASIVAILNQTTIIFAVILATVIVKEPLTRRKTLAVALAIAGACLTVMHKWILEQLPALS